ncbi:MAG TPA: S8 family serine peptidase [Ignavibacteriales bacterium]|nr:S8 family serine peptidase [Ignavibacteriales bacterium]HOL82038.1 S8 family serine peptidase [Ignavibacteriales bacterium]HOM66082.1 S8 family serine peptidase [Ignavibacteriales bacterium]HPD67700.1 S8 family serine peptidase [Ignavibacteriales bacterium]HPP34173.1 S8 family serine peptidase [Ignavibacteriales bacterium]
MKNILLLMLIASISFAKPFISQRLKYYLDRYNSDEIISTIVYFHDQVDLDELEEFFKQNNVNAAQRAYLTITKLQEKSKQYNYFEEAFIKQIVIENSEYFNIQKFWIFNGYQIETKKKNIEKLLNFNEIAYIDLDAPIFRDDPDVGSKVAEGYSISVAIDNLKVVKAHKLWQKGITGKGRLVLGLDSGVDGNHPALNYKWRGKTVPLNQAWFDPNNSNFPSDCEEHGTHTMGTMVGLGKMTGDTVGVAIDAEWIAAKVTCNDGIITSTILSAFQWAMDPDNNPNTTSDMPDAINCSWYDPDVSDECNGVYVQTLTALETVGIAVVFSAGNSGPYASTITKPKNINKTVVNSFCVGAINHTYYIQGNNNPIVSFSSRGPSKCGGTGSLLIKPEVAAPGVNIKSTVPGGGYAQTNWNGTSMASPHVAGAVALLKEAYPDLPGYIIKEALYHTAIDLGQVGEDNDYGKGLIDIEAAYNYLEQYNDKIPPEKVTILSVVDTFSNGAKIQWKTPKDNKGVTNFDIRISENPIDTLNFHLAQKIQYIGEPDTVKLNTLTIKNLMSKTKYYVAIKAMDNVKNYSKISDNLMFTTLDKPILYIDKDTMYLSAAGNFEKIKDSLLIKNNQTTKSTLEFKINIKNKSVEYDNIMAKLVPNQSVLERGSAIYGAGGSDKYGYIWIDNDFSKNVKFVWNDIKNDGDKIDFWDGYSNVLGNQNEGFYGPIDLGFNFNFYNSLRNQIYVSTNGIIAFSPFDEGYGKNLTIPNKTLPNGIIAPLWDELDGKDSGAVYYKVENDKCIIQFENWNRYSITNKGTYTFQVVLNKDNTINLYYKKIDGVSNDCTIGIENFDGTDGLQIVYNAPYLKDSLAVVIRKIPVWYKADTLSAILYNGNSVYYYVEIDDTTLDYGRYIADVIIQSNDDNNKLKVIPLIFKFNKQPLGNEKQIIKNFALYQNFPNPFNPGTNIKFDIARKSHVVINIYDVLGRKVKEIVNGYFNEGKYSIYFDASDMPTGIYFYELSADNFKATKKMMLLK